MKIHSTIPITTAPYHNNNVHVRHCANLNSHNLTLTPHASTRESLGTMFAWHHHQKSAQKNSGSKSGSNGCLNSGNFNCSIISMVSIRQRLHSGDDLLLLALPTVSPCQIERFGSRNNCFKLQSCLNVGNSWRSMQCLFLNSASELLALFDHLRGNVIDLLLEPLSLCANQFDTSARRNDSQPLALAFVYAHTKMIVGSLEKARLGLEHFCFRLFSSCDKYISNLEELVSNVCWGLN